MTQQLVTVDEPQVYLNTAVSNTPSTGTVTLLSASDNLQTAFNNAHPGDVIQLAPGVTYLGNFTIPAISGGISGQWVTVMTAGSIPPEGTRLTATDAATYSIPRIRGTAITPVLQTAVGASKWRFIGIEIDVSTSVTGTEGSGAQQGLVLLGDASSAQNDLTLVPSDFIFDRCYVHGHTNLDTRRAFSFNAARCALIESTVAEIHGTSDCQAVTCSNGPGPHKITNNYLEAGGEVIAYGGAPIWIDGMIPSDIEIRHNVITKNIGWAGTWNTKNLIEFKAGRRALIEGNDMSNSRCDGQAGYAFVLWCANADIPTRSTCEHITVRNNRITNVTGGFNLSDRYNDTITTRLNHVAINNNVVIGLDNPTIACNGRLFSITRKIDNLSIEHNTGFSPSNASVVFSGDSLSDNLVIRNNVMGGPNFPIFSPAGQGSLAWASAAGTGSIFLGNVVAYASDWLNAIPGNFYPADFTAVGLAGGASASTSVSASLADLALSGASNYHNAGTDSTDPGADMTAVAAAISGVGGGSSGSGTGTVTPPLAVLTSLVLAPTTLTVVAGNAGAVNATALDQNGAAMALPALTGHTSDGTKATVSVSGAVVTITGVAAGSANITVSSGTVTSNSVAVTVDAAPVVPVPPPTTPGPVIEHGHKPKITGRGHSPRITGEDF